RAQIVDIAVAVHVPEVRACGAPHKDRVCPAHGFEGSGRAVDAAHDAADGPLPQLLRTLSSHVFLFTPSKQMGGQGDGPARRAAPPARPRLFRFRCRRPGFLFWPRLTLPNRSGTMKK